MSEKVMTVSVIVVRDGIVESVVSFNDNPRGGDEAEAAFLQACADNFSNWDEYDSDDIDVILDEGYAEFGHGTIFIAHSE